VAIETPETDNPAPGMAERAIDNRNRSVAHHHGSLRRTGRRGRPTESSHLPRARQPGKPLSTISAITREAPLASLFVAFLFGVAIARRR